LKPLCIASYKGHVEVVEALLAKGADVEAKTNVRAS
jgi:ankyrin repeat protein